MPQTIKHFETSQARLTLKPGKEKSLLNRHPWIFSGAIASVSKCENGSIVRVESSRGEFLAIGYYNPKSSIAARVLSWENAPAETAIRKNIDSARGMREAFLRMEARPSTGYRLVHGEADLLPGLVIDVYGNAAVIQITTLGMERLRETIIDIVSEIPGIERIIERSTGPSRREEGLADVFRTLHGTEAEFVPFLEDGIRYESDIEGQKTGFFLDQREERKLVRSLSGGKHVLNVFSYSGGFTLSALSGNAESVTSVDISERAIGLCQRHIEMNGFDPAKHPCIAVDAFDYLRKERLDSFDLIVLDPPAFAKKKADVMNACRGYKEINTTTLKKMKAGSLLLTCSCSYSVDSELFQTVVFQAARDAGRSVRIVSRHRLAFDHPVSLFHPESDYLKSLLLYVE